MFLAEQIRNCSPVQTTPKLEYLVPKVVRGVAPKGTSFRRIERAVPSEFPRQSKSLHVERLGLPGAATGGSVVIVLIILLFLLFGGGGYRTYHHGYRDRGGLLMWVLVIFLIIFLMNGGLGHAASIL